MRNSVENANLQGSVTRSTVWKVGGSGGAYFALRRFNPERPSWSHFAQHRV